MSYDYDEKWRRTGSIPWKDKGSDLSRKQIDELEKYAALSKNEFEKETHIHSSGELIRMYLNTCPICKKGANGNYIKVWTHTGHPKSCFFCKVRGESFTDATDQVTASHYGPQPSWREAPYI